MKAHTGINRMLLALAGLVLLGGGLLVLVGGLDGYRYWHLTPPSGWPLTTPHDVLITHADQTRWTNQGWWWPAVIASLALITLLALWWLLAQLRQGTPRRMPVGGTPPTEGVELRHHALSDALADEAGRLPGVQHARVRMAGRPTRPQARITLAFTPDTAPGAVLEELCRGPVEHARQSTGWERLSTHAHLQVARHGPHRAE
jgi:hypothetical protein